MNLHGFPKKYLKDSSTNLSKFWALTRIEEEMLNVFGESWICRNLQFFTQKYSKLLCRIIIRFLFGFVPDSDLILICQLYKQYLLTGKYLRTGTEDWDWWLRTEDWGQPFHLLYIYFSQNSRHTWTFWTILFAWR